jgi:hypothetical protein
MCFLNKLINSVGRYKAEASFPFRKFEDSIVNELIVNDSIHAYFDYAFSPI